MAAGNEDLPAELRKRIESALEELDRQDHARLPLPVRRGVRAQYGDMGHESGERPVGRRRLFELDRMAVERVLPVWRAERPDDERPERMVELAEEVIGARTTWSAVEPEVDRFRTDLMDLSSTMDWRALAAGMAAADLVVVADVGDYGEETPADADDDDLDPDMLATDYLASIAESSVPAIEGEDVEARRAYWRWYLQEAVPAAYRAVDDD